MSNAKQAPQVPPELCLVATVIVEKPDFAAMKTPELPRGGFNPYENSAASHGAGPPASQQAPAEPAPRSKVVIRPRKPNLLERLQDWLDERQRSGKR
jgi:hypothetical protein